jgi:hypothetical protein
LEEGVNVITATAEDSAGNTSFDSITITRIHSENPLQEEADFRTGWWYSIGEDGTGISMEVQGAALFMAWYTYDESTGEPLWLTSGGQMTDPYHYSGSLLKWTGWPLGDHYSVPQSMPVGAIEISYSSETQATVTWTMGGAQGEKIVQRFMDNTSPGDRDSRPIHGWWYDPEFDGMGVFMESQGGNIFIALYSYGDDGVPRWWSSGGVFADGAAAYSGVFYEWENGQCMDCPYKSPDTPPLNRGNLSIQFLNDSEALLTWQGGQLSLTRFLFDDMP